MDDFAPTSCIIISTEVAAFNLSKTQTVRLHQNKAEMTRLLSPSGVYFHTGKHFSWVGVHLFIFLTRKVVGTKLLSNFYVWSTLPYSHLHVFDSRVKWIHRLPTITGIMCRHQPAFTNKHHIDPHQVYRTCTTFQTLLPTCSASTVRRKTNRTTLKASHKHDVKQMTYLSLGRECNQTAAVGHETELPLEGKMSDAGSDGWSFPACGAVSPDKR